GSAVASACGQEEKTLAFAGNYTIRVHDVADSKTGTYDVNVVVVSDSAASCAQAVTCGQSLPGSIHDVGQSNTYKFSVEAGETVSITAHQTSAFLVACWELYDPEGISVVGACGQTEKTLAVAGTYTIRVFDNGDKQTGTYDLNRVVISDTASSCAQPILCGETLARNIAATGESDTYRFVAAAGEAVSITSRETAGFLTACWEIYDPQGLSLGTACGQTEKTLAVAGGYTIRVSDKTESQTGDYQVTLCNPTTTTTTTVPGTTTTTTLAGGGAETLSGSMLLLGDKSGAPQKRRLVVVSRDTSFTTAGPGTAD